MNTIKNKSLLFPLSNFLMILLFSFFAIKIDDFYTHIYSSILMMYILFSFINAFVYYIFNIKFFSPFNLVSLLLSLFFFVAPLIDLITNNVYFFDIYAFNTAIKSSLLFLLGYIVFTIVFIVSNKFRLNRKISKKVDFENISYGYKKKIGNFNKIIWTIIYLFSSINLLRSSLIGQSLGILVENQMNSIGIFSILGYGLVVPWMYIVYTEKKLYSKLLFTFLTILLYFFNGYRFIIVIMFLSFASFYYISNDKNPRTVQIVVTAFVLVLLLSIIGYTRSFLRSGLAINLNEFSLNEILYTFQSNFGIYKAFYIMVDRMPSIIGFTYGKQFLYTFILAIPRFLWVGKPDTPLRELIFPLLGSYALVAGTAWPNIGEYYSEFGVIGICIGFSFLGIMCRIVNNTLYKSSSINTFIFACIFYGSFFQLIIRGYTPTNFWLIFAFGFFICINVLYQSLILKKGECH
ncbi:O-antigen polymerase [Enterococcus gallinarum]|uniref:O-antigen polymerase n=1 Tax=Enterococcus TaxID=1350 RepID=UPI001D10A61E|nr:O-antigen polymerase [Enterococcus gallinarum]MCC2751702.1 oligosaccharide repeat unit polymerase [Enterococcus gallinarum]